VHSTVLMSSLIKLPVYIFYFLQAYHSPDTANTLLLSYCLYVHLLV
jgi:hypothetical protein